MFFHKVGIDRVGIDPSMFFHKVGIDRVTNSHVCLRGFARPWGSQTGIFLNKPGVFLGFATVDGLTGAAILVEKSVVLADQQVAFCDETMPFKDAGLPNNERWSHLHRLR